MAGRRRLRRVDAEREHHVLPAHDRIGEPLRKHASQDARDRVDPGQRHDVARRALQHRHMRGALGQRGDERHGGSAAADHDDSLAGVVDVVAPELRMHQLAAEALDARPVGRVALVVPVVARAREQEPAGHLDRLAAVGALHLDGPARIGRGPLRGHDAVLEADLPVDSVLARRGADVVEDRRAVRDRLRSRPGTERVAEREHVRVRADAREAEQVPRPAARSARLENREALARTALLQPAGCANTRDAGADDQHVDVVASHVIQPNAARAFTGGV